MVVKLEFSSINLGTGGVSYSSYEDTNRGSMHQETHYYCIHLSPKFENEFYFIVVVGGVRKYSSIPDGGARYDTINSSMDRRLSEG